MIETGFFWIDVEGPANIVHNRLHSRSAVKAAYERKRLCSWLWRYSRYQSCFRMASFTVSRSSRLGRRGPSCRPCEGLAAGAAQQAVAEGKEAKWNVRDARPLLRLKKSRFRLTRFPFHDPLRFHRKLSGDLCGRQACTLAGPREDAGINKRGLAHGGLGISKGL